MPAKLRVDETIIYRFQPRLDALGRNDVQGYLFSRPLPDPEITQLLHREALHQAQRQVV